MSDKRNTVEQDIVEFIKSSGDSLTNKAIIDRFNVSLEYVKSLKWRLKREDNKDKLPLYYKK